MVEKVWEKMAQQEAMGLTEFFENFSTEEACREYLYLKRWTDGFVCPKCGVKDEPFQITSRHKYQCKHCNHQTSVTAGTVMDKSRTPLTKWFLAIYLMSADKRGCSALRLKKELKIAYDTAWTMSHKIRKAMKKRDEGYQLSGYVEMDEGFFGSPSEGEGKRGRGTDKAPVVIGLSLDEAGHPEFVKAKVLETVDGESIVDFAHAAVEEGSSIASDGLSIYRKLAEKGYIHLPENFNPIETPEHLKWLHIVISNLKSFLNGTYHGVAKIHLQTFLDEFCYRFNRRFWPSQLFARTLLACSSAPPFTRYDLIG
jgi:transposase-like protein